MAELKMTRDEADGDEWNPGAHIYAVCEHCGKKIYFASQRGADWSWYHCFNYAKHCNYDNQVRDQRGHVAEPNIIQLASLKAYASSQSEKLVGIGQEITEKLNEYHTFDDDEEVAAIIDNLVAERLAK